MAKEICQVSKLIHFLIIPGELEPTLSVLCSLWAYDFSISI